MGCEKKLFKNIDEQLLWVIRDEMGRSDLSMPEAFQGEVTSKAFGVTVAFDYSHDEEALSLEVTKKPLFIPCGMIYKKAEEAIDRARVKVSNS